MRDVCCVDIIIEFMFKDQTVSWVRIVSGIKKYVTETSQEIPVENVQLFIKTGRLVVNLSSNNVPIRERKLIDINPAKFSQSCFVVSKFMIFCDMIR